MNKSNNNAVLMNLLKERGIIDFKPFIDKDGSEQLWGYCTQIGDCRYFHLCKSTLEEVPTKKLRECVSYSQRPFFLIRVSEESYSVLPEEVDLAESSDNGWLVNSDNVIVNTNVPGYKVVGNYLILIPKLEEMMFGEMDTICWKPQEQCPMYHFGSDSFYNDIGTLRYCASYSDYHIGHSKYGYFVFNEYGNFRFDFMVLLSKANYYYADSFLIYNNISYLVHYDVGQNHELVWEAYHFIDKSITSIEVEVIVQIKTGIIITPKDKGAFLDDCQIEWCCSHKYFALTNHQTNSNVKSLCIASWNWAWGKSKIEWGESKSILFGYSQTLNSSIIENDKYLVKVGDGVNGVLVLGNDNDWRDYALGRYFIYDIYGNILADNVLKDSEYTIIKRAIPDKGHLFSTKVDNYQLSGVIRMEDLSVMIPMQYQEIIIESTHPDLVVFGRIDFGDKSKYELLKNGDVILPRTISDCELSKMKSNDMVLVREGDKYDIIYKGERCLPTKYDMIEETKPNVYLVLTNGKEKHLYIIADKYVTRGFNSINILFDNYSSVIFIGDGVLIKIANGKENVILEDCPPFICSDKNGFYYVFKEDDLNFVCFNNYGEEIELEEYYCDNVDCYKIENEDLWFVPKERVIVDNLSKYCDIDNDYWDNYDYDEDTYYALGGTDYDKFRENGGSIDDMMDGMGL
ncbi:MAG: hypothetical protein IKK04_11050 [Bacteroidales bacterium]|nr:hypothetical protein [Bacteroidales bacterium]